MATNEETTIEVCRRLLRQAAWRLQYRMRTQQEKESTSLLDYQAYCCSFEMEIVSDLYVSELLDEIPWEKGRYVIQKVVLEGMTEKEVALELKITQQAVNKWKRKGLEALRKKLSRSYKV